MKSHVDEVVLIKNTYLLHIYIYVQLNKSHKCSIHAPRTFHVSLIKAFINTFSKQIAKNIANQFRKFTISTFYNLFKY